jgi:hypothetical protein
MKTMLLRKRQHKLFRWSGRKPGERLPDGGVKPSVRLRELPKEVAFARYHRKLAEMQNAWREERAAAATDPARSLDPQ